MTAKYTIAATLTANSGQFVAGFAAAEAAASKFQRTMHTVTSNTRTSVDKLHQTTAHASQSVGSLGAAMGTAATHLGDAGKKADGASKGMANAGKSAENGRKGFSLFGNSASLAARDLDRFNRVGRGVSMTAMGVGAAIVGGIGASLYVFTQYEAALAGVAKTTNASATEMRKFDLAFRNMSRTMPAGYEEIAKVAETAAQLGVQNKNIEKFTETMIRMGTSTNLASEDAANALSRMMNIMGTSQGDVDRFASTIVKMGNVSAATEQDIVNMGMRIAGMGKSVGMSEADVVALATSLSNLGVRAEMGGSAISTIMSKTVSAIEQGTDKGQKWADVMGMSIGKVQKLFKEDAYGGLIKMVEGLEKVKESGGNLDKTLRDLGINEIRQLDVMKRLVGNSHELADAQRIANGEWKTNTALLQESSKRYETFGSRVKMAWNGIQNIAANIGGAFAKADGGSMAWINNIIDGLENLTNKFFDAEGGISRFGQKAVETMTRWAELAGGLAATAAAFMMFGPQGAAIVGAVSGLTILGLEFKKLYDKAQEGKTAFGQAMQDISSGVSEATEGKAEKFLKMRDGINQAMTDIRIRSTDEARKTKSEILAEVDSLTNEVIQAINAKENQILAINKRLVQSATGQEKEALKQSVSEIKAHFEQQRQLAANAQASITKILSTAYSERRQLTTQEYGTLSNMFAGLDKMYSTHVSKNIDEMNRLTRTFQTFDKNTKFDNVQRNVTSFAKETANAMMELEKGFKKQSNILQNSGLDADTLSLHMKSLSREYTENKARLLENLNVHEKSAQKLYKNVDALKGLTKEQRAALDTAELLHGKTGQYNAKLDTYGSNMEGMAFKTKTLSQASKDAAAAMESSKSAVDRTASAYLKMQGSMITLKGAYDVIKTSSKSAATAMGEGFVSSIEKGVKMVNLGSAGKMKLDEFVNGIKSGEISVQQAAIAQVNAMRASLGQGSLSPEGEKQMQSFINGLQAKSTSIGDIANQLGLTLQSGMKVDLGSAGKVTADSFVSGLKTGQYGAAELMTFFTNTLKTASIADLSSSGSQTMQSLKSGLESGLIGAEQIMEALKGRIKASAKADLMGEGQVTLQSLVAGYESGKYSVETFMIGLQQLAKASAKADLSNEGLQSMNSFSTGMLGGTGLVTTAAESAKLSVEQILFGTDGTLGGTNAMNSFNSGIMATWGTPKASADSAKAYVEGTLGLTGDGGGGSNAMNLFNLGLQSGTEPAKQKAAETKSSVETSLGSTSDGGGGEKAGGGFLAGLTKFFTPATAQAAEMKSGVENNLGSTSDGGGGAKAGNKFANDLANKKGASNSAAQANKSAVEGVLRTSNDGGGGNRAGTMFVSGVRNQSGNARSAGNNVSSSARGGLSSNSNTYGLGQDFGSGFVNGIRSFIGAAINAAASLARAAINAVRATQNSHSPAKETWALGDDFSDGYILAIDGRTGDAVTAARGMASSAIDAVRRASTGGFDLGAVLTPSFAGGEINKRLSSEIKTTGDYEISGKQAAHINVQIGRSQFEAFTDDIYHVQTRKANFKDAYRQ